VFASPAVNGNLNTLLADVVGKTLWIEQLKAIALTLAIAIIGTTVIAYVVKAVIGLRVDEEVESIGLDLAEHGEEAYHAGALGGHMSRPGDAPGMGFSGDRRRHPIAKPAGKSRRLTKPLLPARTG